LFTGQHQDAFPRAVFPHDDEWHTDELSRTRTA
jgi:hypothetical protein